jgi:hypothetical protein
VIPAVGEHASLWLRLPKETNENGVGETPAPVLRDRLNRIIEMDNGQCPGRLA